MPSALLAAATNHGIFHYCYKTSCALVVTYGTKSEPEMTGSDTAGWAVCSNWKALGQLQTHQRTWYKLSQCLKTGVSASGLMPLQ